MEDKILNQLVKKINGLNVPYYCIGRIMKKDGSTRFFEVVIKRPERYHCKDMLKKIPKIYRNIKVKVV